MDVKTLRLGVVSGLDSADPHFTNSGKQKFNLQRRAKQWLIGCW